MDKRIPVSVFENAVARHPDAIAVEAPDGTLTYTGLDKAGNAVANCLLSHGVEAGSVVAVFIPNSATYIVSIIGVQKACGVFMPADPNAPLERQVKMFAKADPAAVIVDEEQLPVFQQFAESVVFTPRLLMVVSTVGPCRLYLNGSKNHLHVEMNVSHPGILPCPEDDLYIIFTSGTTGTPKAVLGRQKGLAHFLAWERIEFGFDESVRASNLAPTTFDVSLRDIFVPLTAGGTVVIPAESIKSSPVVLLDWLTDHEINLVHIVPSVFRLLLDELEKRPTPLPLLTSLRYFMLAGEAVYGRDVIRFRAIVGDSIHLVNLYGPTETTLAKLFHRLDFSPDNAARIMPLGNPISNTAVLIITNNRLAEIGEIGEICIKTPFRSKGYYGDPELTATSFVVNPLTGDPEDIIYRTGDMGRYLPDRSVEFIGRMDRQVKVNGVRVELSEVDEAVSACPGIKNALVMPYVHGIGETSLICYYTEESPVDVGKLRERLAGSLYSAMIPSFYVRLDSFPLGINGKIDRRALPKPDEIIYEDTTFVAPESATEIRLAAIWAEILGIRKIGVDISFNVLGGGSMQAIRCVGAISRAFCIDISIRDFFAAGTVRALAEMIDAAHDRADNAAIPRQPERPDYPATHSQKRFWTLQKMIPGFTAYNIAGCFRIIDELNENALERALHSVISRHDILRTVFFERGSELRQRVLPETGFRLEHIGFADSVEKVNGISDGFVRTIFDLEHSPLLRAGVYSDSSGTLLVFAIHHIICDAWSLDIILGETLDEYDSIMNGLPSLPASPTLQYRDFAAWQNANLTSGAFEKQRRYWLEHLSGELPRIDLPLDAVRPSRRTYRGATYSYIVPEETLAKANKYASANGSTLFSILLAGLRVLLYRYSGQNDIVVNSPVTLRGRPELESIPGDFTNTVLLRSTINDDMPFSQLVKEANTDIDRAIANREYPFDLLIQELNVTGDMSRAPVTDIGITLVEDYGGMSQEHCLKLEPFELDSGISKYDIVFHFSLSYDGLALSIEYDSAIFNKNRIRRMGDNIAALLSHGLLNPDTAVSALEILAPTEKAMIESFQFPRPRNYPDSTIHGAFANIVAEQPKSCALVLNDGSEMTFADVDRESNRIAAMLMENGCSKGDRIAVYLHRSPVVPVAIIGILKAGCVYVPIADDAPPARIEFMMNDCGAAAAIADDDLAQNLPGSINKLRLADIDDIPFRPPAVEVAPTDDAYIIYTSGSTGRPKGVLLPHLGLVNRARDLRERASITSSDRFTQFASLSFDASIYEIFCALLNGASLIVVDRETIENPDAFVDLLRSKGVTFTLLPPTYLRRLGRRPLPGIRVLKTAGEAADHGDALHYAHDVLYLNGYGPTEDSICSSVFTVDPSRDYSLGIPIGIPVGDTEAMVLDKNMRQVPIGVLGQLCVSDRGLASGYLNLPELTSKSFVIHPFDKTKRMYLTGDLARWEEDGNLLFLGRMDYQVKIGGHRIEPGEIESVMRELKGIITVSVVPVGKENDLRLAAYYTGKVEEEEIRTTLQESLPLYMIPHFFKRMDSLPLTPSGKINRKALPDIHENVYDVVREASTDEETVLLAIVREVLGNSNIGIDTNYFSAGGDSIRAIQAASRLREHGWSLSAGDFFVAPVISDLARIMTRTVSTLSSKSVSGLVKTTPILEWFTETVTARPEHFNQAVMLKIEGSIEISPLKAALSAVWRHHDALRMRAAEDGFTILSEETPFSFEIIDAYKSTDPNNFLLETVERMQRSFDLMAGPLYKAILFRRDIGDRLFLVAHHLIVDAVSWGILARDIETAYVTAKNGGTILLPDKTHSYRDWADTLHSLVLSGYFDGELLYWGEIVEAECDTIAPVESSEGQLKTLSAHIEEIESTGILDERGSQEVLARMLAGLAAALNRWKDLDRVRIQLDGHGRGITGTGIDIGRTVGWFTAVWPIVLDCSQDVPMAFTSIHKTLKDIPNGGVGYGVLRYLAGHEKLEAETDISFNYLGRLEFMGSTLSLAEEPVGETVSSENRLGYTVEFLLSSVGDTLEIQMTFDTGRITESEAENLLTLYKSYLKTAAECRASDFDYNDFGESGLDGFIENL